MFRQNRNKPKKTGKIRRPRSREFVPFRKDVPKRKASLWVEKSMVERNMRPYWFAFILLVILSAIFVGIYVAFEETDASKMTALSLLMLIISLLAFANIMRYFRIRFYNETLNSFAMLAAGIIASFIVIYYDPAAINSDNPEQTLASRPINTLYIPLAMLGTLIMIAVAYQIYPDINVKSRSRRWENNRDMESDAWGPAAIDRANRNQPQDVRSWIHNGNQGYTKPSLP